MIDSSSPIILSAEEPSYIEQLNLQPQHQIDISVIQPEVHQKKVNLVKGEELLQNQPFYVLFNFEQIPDNKIYQLYVSSYRVILNCSMVEKIVSIPHGYIKQMFCYQKQIRFILKTGLKVFVFPQQESVTNKIYQNISKGKLFIPFCLQFRYAEEEPIIYDCLAEMERMRINWKKCLVLKNPKGQICSTYPKNIFIPGKASQQLVEECKSGRVGNRLPVLSYYYSCQSVSLWRGAHTLKDHNTKYDYSYLELISEKLLIIQIEQIDNRKQSYHGFNHFNNFIKFKPYRFDTLYNVRLNYQKVVLTYLKSTTISQMCNALQKWYEDIQMIINCSFKAAEYLKEGRHVFIQQNDNVGKNTSMNTMLKGGIDRACQISAITAIIMDPFYRTFNGLSVIIQRQFVSFGYPFHLRTFLDTQVIKNGNSPKKQAEINLNMSVSSLPERQKYKSFSPTFIQFLQCVHQLINCFPSNFEYSAFYLSKIGYQLYTCKFNNFLFNSRHQKQAEKDIKFTTSLWRKFPKPKQYHNIQFKQSSSNVVQLINLRKCPSPKQYVIWRQYWDMVTMMECQKEAYCQIEQINELKLYLAKNQKKRKEQWNKVKQNLSQNLKKNKELQIKMKTQVEKKQQICLHLNAQYLQKSQIIIIQDEFQSQSPKLSK